MTTPTRRGLPDLGELEIEHGLRAISHDLTKKFTGRLSPQTCDRFVRECYALMDRKATIRVLLVALTRRFAWDRLTALDKCRTPWPPESPRCCSSACTTPAAPSWPPPRDDIDAHVRALLALLS